MPRLRSATLTKLGSTKAIKYIVFFWQDYNLRRWDFSNVRRFSYDCYPKATEWDTWNPDRNAYRTWILKKRPYRLKVKLELFDTTSILHPSYTQILSRKCWLENVPKKHKKSVLMVRRLAPIVPPGAFTNQLRPNPHILSPKKPQQRNEKPVLVEI